ncbi:hypothetical protein TNCV_2439521 [Trichonephila clavipes]|nr:hypothetical protein TNCV_2439521 [Trichonephila clavipes]
MTTTSYRSRSAVGVRHFFRRGTTLLAGRVFCTRNDDNDILPQMLGGGCFSAGHYFCPVESFYTRDDDNDILPQSLWVSSPSRDYSAVRSRLFTRKDDNDILPQPLCGGCSSLFFPSRHYSAVVAS